MAMRLQELHPALVHFPIAALPTTVAIDLAAGITRNPSLERLGRWGMLLTAGGAALAAASGLMAQEEVNVDGPALDTLITHRNLNATVLALTSVLAVRRMRQPRVTLGHLVAAAAGMAAVFYTAYLGGKLVYEYGAGVEAADGVRPGGTPELTRAGAPNAGRTAARDLGSGVKHMVQEVAQGKLAPSLFGNGSTNGHAAVGTARQAD